MKTRLTATAAAAAAALLPVPVAASATTGAAYGEQISQHVTTQIGFTGDHNRGVHHQGFSGWDGTIHSTTD